MQIFLISMVIAFSQSPISEVHRAIQQFKESENERTFRRAMPKKLTFTCAITSVDEDVSRGRHIKYTNPLNPSDESKQLWRSVSRRDHARMDVGDSIEVTFEVQVRRLERPSREGRDGPPPNRIARFNPLSKSKGITYFVWIDEKTAKIKLVR